MRLFHLAAWYGVMGSLIYIIESHDVNCSTWATILLASCDKANGDKQGRELSWAINLPGQCNVAKPMPIETGAHGSEADGRPAGREDHRSVAYRSLYKG